MAWLLLLLLSSLIIAHKHFEFYVSYMSVKIESFYVQVVGEDQK